MVAQPVRRVEREPRVIHTSCPVWGGRQAETGNRTQLTWSIRRGERTGVTWKPWCRPWALGVTVQPMPFGPERSCRPAHDLPVLGAQAGEARREASDTKTAAATPAATTVITSPGKLASSP